MPDAWKTEGGFGTYCDDDLVRWASDGSSHPGLDDALRAAARARFLRMAIGPSYGSEVEGGLARADVEAALRLAGTPAVDLAGLDAKRLVLQGGPSISYDGLVEAMVRSALDHDARRLAAVRRSTAREDRAVSPATGTLVADARRTVRLAPRTSGRRRDAARPV